MTQRILTVVLPFILLMQFACGSSGSSNTAVGIDSTNRDQPAATSESTTQVFAEPEKLPALKSFLDSVGKKYPLSISQIVARTIIDSVFFTEFNSDASFTGDSVFRFDNHFIAAILSYSDGKVCSKKWLLVFDSTGYRNTDEEFIQSNCDCPEDMSCRRDSYKLHKNSIVEIIETEYPAALDTTGAKPVSTSVKWRVNKMGMLDSTGLQGR